ncbi:MAG: hypothetical protein OEV00_07185 [Acidobacteriota bacterium]|nr:hypothetical protein [Acidobacteriota bacterium]MDH3785096.1 hypothetical protein [Acidobacteriota bacterium]
MSPTVIIFLLVLFLVVALYVVQPLLRGGRPRSAIDAERLSQARTLESRQAMLVASIRDLEDDLAGDKIDKADHDTLHAQLTRETLEVMRELDQLQAQHAVEVEKRTRTLPHPGATSSET